MYAQCCQQSTGATQVCKQQQIASGSLYSLKQFICKYDYNYLILKAVVMKNGTECCQHSTGTTCL